MALQTAFPEPFQFGAIHLGRPELITVEPKGGAHR